MAVALILGAAIIAAAYIQSMHRPTAALTETNVSPPFFLALLLLFLGCVSLMTRNGVRPTQSVCACVNRIEDDERVVPRREEEEEGGREGKRGVTNKKRSV